MPLRNSAVVYHQQRLDLTHTLPWLAQRSAATGVRTTLFHLVQFGLVRTLVERPELHRFVAGGRIYQRTHLELAFAVKKRMDDKAPLTAVKVRFLATDGFADVVAKADGVITSGRGESLSPSEKEMKLATILPLWLLRAAIGLQRRLDAWNLLPAAATAHDPLYSSAFLANLGSIGLPAPFHHLFDWGTVPIFVVVGRAQKAPWVDDAGAIVVRDTCELRYSYDERVADGLYCAKSLEILRHMVERPDLVIGDG
ncbi:MAG: 2-oxo acid dehydrogenase subunit E2 [Deltaproteobacteria bacterium]|nr:2-oxo acid dehydrogenase subunit E2 [Deltaproteobacteria bacterium]